MSSYPSRPVSGPLADQTNRDWQPRPFPMALPVKSEPQEAPVTVKSEAAVKPEPVVKPEPIVASLHDAAVAVPARPEPVNLHPLPGSAPAQDDNGAAVPQQPYTPEHAFKAIQRHITHLSSLITDPTLALPASRLKSWQAELVKLKECCGPRTVIAVVGATGAGKSSVINALLDQSDLVPTNCMRACTAVVTEISYHKKNEIEADIEFLSKEEWKQELTLLLEDLVDEDGNIRRSSDLRSETGIAFAKFTAVYPRINLDELKDYSVDDLMDTGVVAHLLGRTERVSSTSGKDFAAKVSKWVDSREKKSKKKDKDGKKEKEKDQQEYWPLVKIVRIRVKSQTLSTGAVLVDLPGSQDSNAARSAVAKTYMRNADAIWILAPINRAVDDKVAKDLMGDAWKKQALMDGDYNANVMTFICSKTDDISAREAIRSIDSLRDNEELTQILEELDEVDPRISQNKKDRTALKRNITRMKSQEDDAKLERKEWGDRLFAKKTGKKWVAPTKKGRGKKRKSMGSDGGKRKKRKGEDDEEDASDSDADASGSDDDIESDSDAESDIQSESDSDESKSDSIDEDMDKDGSSEDEDEDEDDMGIEEIERVCEEKKTTCKTLRTQLADARKQVKNLNKTILKDQAIASRLNKRKAAICSLARNEYSKDAIKEDFRAGLRELEEAAAQEQDPENFDPDEVLRDYDALDLPVFCVSAREYAKIKKLNKSDGKPAVFTEAQETEVPLLQKHAQDITWEGRDAAARKSIELLRNFSRQVEVYLGADGQASFQDRAEVKAIFKEEATRLLDALDAIALEKSNTLKRDFKAAVKDKLHEGVQEAEKGAVAAINEFGYTTHWCTYRATMRRDGVWRRNLNEILIQPVIDQIAYSWKKLFGNGAKEMFLDLPTRMIAKANEHLKLVEERAAVGVQDRIRAVREQQQESMTTSFNNMAASATAIVMDLQKDITRQISPDVARQLAAAYSDASAQVGKGTFIRMKTIMQTYISQNTSLMFAGTGRSTLQRLDALGDKAHEAMLAELKPLFKRLKLAYDSIWEDIRINEEQLQRRATVRQRAQEVTSAMNTLTEQAKEAQRSAQFISNLEEQMEVEANLFEPFAGPVPMWDRFLAANRHSHGFGASSEGEDEDD